jgi:hypothetical protein
MKLEKAMHAKMLHESRKELLAVDPNYKEVESMKLYTLVGTFCAWTCLFWEDGDVVLARVVG